MFFLNFVFHDQFFLSFFKLIYSVKIAVHKHKIIISYLLIQQMCLVSRCLQLRFQVDCIIDIQMYCPFIFFVYLRNFKCSCLPIVMIIVMMSMIVKQVVL